MKSPFTLAFQLWSSLLSIGLFVAAVYFTRVTRSRGIRALVAALLCTALNLLWDLIAYKAVWWWYPAQTGAILPVFVYFAQDLTWCGALGLLGWRVYRRFNLLPLIGFVLLFSAIGCVRDSFISSRTKAIAFSPGPTSRIADFVCWLTLLTTAQICISTPAHTRKRRNPYARNT